MKETLNNQQVVIAIAIMSGVTFLTRALPFWIFGKKERVPPKALLYLGCVLPYTVIALLAVYCFKAIDPLGSWGTTWPVLAASLTVALLQVWKRNNLISIFGGTILYMILIRVF